MNLKKWQSNKDCVNNCMIIYRHNVGHCLAEPAPVSELQYTETKESNSFKKCSCMFIFIYTYVQYTVTCTWINFITFVFVNRCLSYP